MLLSLHKNHIRYCDCYLIQAPSCGETARSCDVKQTDAERVSQQTNSLQSSWSTLMSRKWCSTIFLYCPTVTGRHWIELFSFLPARRSTEAGCLKMSKPTMQQWKVGLQSMDWIPSLTEGRSWKLGKWKSSIFFVGDFCNPVCATKL